VDAKAESEQNFRTRMLLIANRLPEMRAAISNAWPRA
jgi:hypothetical protein